MKDEIPMPLVFDVPAAADEIEEKDEDPLHEFDVDFPGVSCVIPAVEDIRTLVAVWVDDGIGCSFMAAKKLKCALSGCFESLLAIWLVLLLLLGNLVLVWSSRLVILVGMLVNLSKLVRKISDSTAQAETYAQPGVIAVKSVIWLRGMLEMGFKQIGPTVLRGDNLTMVNQTEVSMNHERSRHYMYRIAQAFIRSAVERGIVKVVHERSDNLEADMNTKILGKVLFAKFFERISGQPQFLDDG
jgi:hypothetical protein